MKDRPNINRLILKRTNGFVFILAVIVITGSGFFYPAQEKTARAESFIVDTLASGLSVPWDIVFLPNGKMLFTERPGRVRVYANHALQAKPLLTIDSIEAKGKMGLLGMCLHPDFASNHFIYLAYNYRVDKQTFLRVARYVYSDDSLTHATTIIENIPGVFNHTGSRLKFGPGKKLYISTGDADVPRLAQDLKTFNGKILRLNDDGSIPAGNPFEKNDTARHEIWTYGHRNPQGIAFQPVTNFLYSSEHGPTGGDEINLISRGNNYGWPVIHHRDAKDGMMLPLLEFTPSIGPAEAIFCSGKAFPALKGHLLVACMRGEAILNMTLANTTITSYNFLLKNVFGRIRALAEGPDGYLYISTSQVDPPESNKEAQQGSFDLLLRIRPAAPGRSTGKIIAIPTGKQTTAIMSAATTTRLTATGTRPAASMYAQLCAGCHGSNMQGKERIPSLADKQWLNGGTPAAIQKSIRQGVIAKGMPAWEGVLSPGDISRMTNYILAHKK